MEPRPNSSITESRGEQLGRGAHHGSAAAAHPWSVVLHPSGDNCSFMAGNHITSQSKEWRVREEEETEGKKTWMASEQWWRASSMGAASASTTGNISFRSLARSACMHQIRSQRGVKARDRCNFNSKLDIKEQCTE